MNPQNEPQDQKNLILAIVLSLAVLLGWQYFFAAPKLREEQARREYTKELDAQRNAGSKGLPGVATAPVGQPSANAPATAGGATQAPLSRDEALKGTPRLAINTPSLEGSIALKGGRLDDLVLVKYRETVDPNSAKVTLLSPAGGPLPYFAEYGWVAQSGASIKVPDRDTVWTIEKGQALTPDSPVTLNWDNGAGLVFRRTISVDHDYMFKFVDDF